MCKPFDIQKFIKNHNDNVIFNELEYCKDTGKTYSHIQTYNFNDEFYNIRHTHKIIKANNAEIRTVNAVMELVKD